MTSEAPLSHSSEPSSELMKKVQVPVYGTSTRPLNRAPQLSLNRSSSPAYALLEDPWSRLASIWTRSG